MLRESFDVVEPWLQVALVLATAAVAAALVHGVAFWVLGRLTSHTAGTIDDALVRYARGPAWLILTTFAVVLVVPGLHLSDALEAGIRRVLTLVLTASFGWLALRVTGAISEVAAQHYDIDAADNLKAREMHTRLRLLQRMLGVVIVAVTASVILMSIPGVRQIGVTLFASAGIAGIVAGFAARPVLSNLLAGVQLALTQPIRIDDVVIVEGEWGWVEEIRMTFVVVRIWDLRRLIVPLSYFIERPFQNWTRTTADILGTVYLYADYTVPVQAVREELHRVLEGHPMWDGKVWGLQVTNTSERAVELRALMGARNSGEAWDLRCHVRESLLAFLQREHPQALPRVRAELDPGVTPAPAASRS